jgi:hypothetical protein
VPDGFSGNGREEFAAFWEPFIGHNIVLNVFMFVPCINSIKALLLFHDDAHNHKITGILKQLKIPTVAPTCFGSRRNHHQGAIFVLS